MTTGTLQQMVYLKGLVPFRRPLILGAEWVSYSAILTCRHAGIRPVALLDEGQGGTDAAPRWFAPTARLAFANGTLVSMEVKDAVGQRTEIRFSGWKRNPAFATGTFKYAPAKGVDVVGGP